MHKASPLTYLFLEIPYRSNPYPKKIIAIPVNERKTKVKTKFNQFKATPLSIINFNLSRVTKNNIANTIILKNHFHGLTGFSFVPIFKSESFTSTTNEVIIVSFQ